MVLFYSYSWQISKYAVFQVYEISSPGVLRTVRSITNIWQGCITLREDAKISLLKININNYM
jgi:hypothetical protein